MKKIAIISDLHIDFWARNYKMQAELLLEEQYKRLCDEAKQNGAEMMFIAGDTINGSSDLVPIFTTMYDLPAIIIPGNHDYYGRSIQSDAQTLVQDNIFAGTLWTDFNGVDDLTAKAIFRCINDFYQIEGSSIDVLKQHFYQTLKEIDELNPEIVMTHFPPHLNSVARQYKGDFHNPYFINNLQDMWFEKKDIKLWICGHTHWKHSYKIGNTLVVCNPCGYPYENHRKLSEYSPMYVEKIDNEWTVVD